MFSLYRVTYGNGKKQSVKFYYTYHHAEQFARAMKLNGTKVKVDAV
jgi:hypothetical protein